PTRLPPRTPPNPTGHPRSARARHRPAVGPGGAAERVGFEPTESLAALTSLAGRRLRPDSATSPGLRGVHVSRRGPCPPRPTAGARGAYWCHGQLGRSGPGRRRRLAVLGALAVVVVAVAAVLWTRRDDGSDTATEPPEPAEEGVLPLLGTTGEVPQRAALAVKVDATAHGRPQVGLLAADVVFEEVVEGGLTRLLAVYHSTDPETVGPVRSARSTDLFLLAE